MIATSFLNVWYFLNYFSFTTFFQMSNINYHINFISSIFDSLFCFKYLSFRGHMSQWKSNHSSNLNYSAFQILFCFFDKACRDAYSNKFILSGFITNFFYICPCSYSFQDSMINILINLRLFLIIICYRGLWRIVIWVSLRSIVSTSPRIATLWRFRCFENWHFASIELVNWIKQDGWSSHSKTNWRPIHL